MARNPFKFLDTASSRAFTTDLAQKIAHERVAIVGVGGTGSYVLDLIAKTWVKDILLFDNDEFQQHNSFRSPGAFSRQQVEGKPKAKASFFSNRYAQMRRGIKAVDQRIDETNVHLLGNCDTVFLCIDGGPVKRIVLDTCVQNDVLLIDCGMGVHRTVPGGPAHGNHTNFDIPARSLRPRAAVS